MGVGHALAMVERAVQVTQHMLPDASGRPVLELHYRPLALTLDSKVDAEVAADGGA